MVKRVFILLLMVCLVGCSAFQTKTVVAQLPEPPTITRPDLESDNLTEDMTIDVLIQAYRVSIIKLKDYAKQLEKTLDTYRRSP